VFAGSLGRRCPRRETASLGGKKLVLSMTVRRLGKPSDESKRILHKRTDSGGRPVLYKSSDSGDHKKKEE